MDHPGEVDAKKKNAQDLPKPKRKASLYMTVLLL